MSRPRTVSPDDDRVVAIIAEQLRTAGFAPTLRELADLCGLASHGAMDRRLQRLEREGRVARTPGIARSLRVLR